MTIAEIETDWLTDGSGNRASIRYFGSRSAAQAALDSLKNCDGCTNCSRCSVCSGCSGCSDCSDCSGCSRCSDCSIDFAGAPPVPVIPHIDAAILAAAERPGALDMRKWHACGTTHCRAGWAVDLAGEAGYALERYHNTALAAQLIYRESGSPINPCRFYDDDAAALADMRRRAAEAL